VAIRPAEHEPEGDGAVNLECGPLEETLATEGVPLGELRPGTRLRIGDAVLVEVTGGSGPDAPAAGRRGGIVEAPDGVRVGAHVVSAGVVRASDTVGIDAVPVPLEDALDLHTFRPEDIPAVVEEYLRQARAAGLGEVRIIHGRGRGIQREMVRRALASSAEVAAFRDAPPERGGWGATVVRLRGPRR